MTRSFGAVESGALTRSVASQAARAWQELEADLQVRVKPEAVLHILSATLKERMPACYGVLATGRPNHGHRVIGRLAGRNGAALVTTNFDRYLEQAIEEEGRKVRVFVPGEKQSFSTYRPEGSRTSVMVLKPHGTLEHPESIRATLRAVGHPASPDLRRAIIRAVEGRHLVLVGYSGNDFDLFPVLRVAMPRARSVWWICRSAAGLTPDLRELPAHGALVLTDAQRIFADLGRQLRFDFEAIPNSGKPPPPVAQQLAAWAEVIPGFDCGFAVAHLLMHVGRWQVAGSCCRSLVRGRRIARLSRVRVFNLLGLCHKRTVPAQAVRAFRQGEALLRPQRRTYRIVYSNLLGNIGGVLHEMGRHEEAARYLRRSMRWARGSWLHVCQNQNDLAGVLDASDRSREAVEILRRTIRRLRRRGELLTLSLSLNNLALCYRTLGDLPRALRTLRESLHLKEKESSLLPLFGTGLVTLGEMLIEADRAADALVHLKRARGILQSLDDQKSLAHTACLEAVVHWRAGDADLARASRNTAERAVRANPRWLRDRRFANSFQAMRQGC